MKKLLIILAFIFSTTLVKSQILYHIESEATYQTGKILKDEDFKKTNGYVFFEDRKITFYDHKRVKLFSIITPYLLSSEVDNYEVDRAIPQIYFYNGTIGNKSFKITFTYHPNDEVEDKSDIASLTIVISDKKTITYNLSL